jgi:hypothetical protein
MLLTKKAICAAVNEGQVVAPYVADERQVAAPSLTRARSPRRLRRGLGPHAAANKGYVAAPPPTRTSLPHRQEEVGARLERWGYFLNFLNGICFDWDRTSFPRWLSTFARPVSA